MAGRDQKSTRPYEIAERKQITLAILRLLDSAPRKLWILSRYFMSTSPSRVTHGLVENRSLASAKLSFVASQKAVRRVSVSDVFIRPETCGHKS